MAEFKFDPKKLVAAEDAYCRTPRMAAALTAYGVPELAAEAARVPELERERDVARTRAYEFEAAMRLHGASLQQNARFQRERLEAQIARDEATARVSELEAQLKAADELARTADCYATTRTYGLVKSIEEYRSVRDKVKLEVDE